MPLLKKNSKKNSKKIDKDKNLLVISTNINKLNNDELKMNLHLLLKEKSIIGENIAILYKTLQEFSQRKLNYVNDIDDKIFSTPKLGKHVIFIENKLKISDPSYIKSNKDLSIILKVKPGEWNVYYHSWISKNPNALIIVHTDFIDDATKNKNIVKCKSNSKGMGIPVDTGMISIMDEKLYPSFNNDQKEEQLNFAMKIRPQQNKLYKKLKNIYCVTSGFGDGYYNYTICKENNQIIKIIIYFIP